jgi:uncharacterized membrane protein
MLEGLTALAHAWGEYYGDHKLLETGVTFAHIGGLIVSGGLAVASDRLVLRSAGPDPKARTVALDVLGTTPRAVVAGLTVVVLSGVLLFLADLDTFLTSWLFWAKMGLVAALLGNGLLLMKAEKILDVDAASPVGWTRLRRGATVSLALWLLITLLGTALVNAA